MTVMKWVVFSYSLPSKSSSSPRVTLWRRLQKLGAISPTGGMFILPPKDECIEAFQWLAQEVQAENGQALVMHVEAFDGFSDQQLIELFRAARRPDYKDIETLAVDLEKSISDALSGEQRAERQEELAKLQRQHAGITRIDYFESPESTLVAGLLSKVAEKVFPSSGSGANVKAATIKAYQKASWVTRPKPHVDRLACAWLIRRFINADAFIRYADKPKQDEVAFDMKTGEFGHRGNLCTFEVMVRAFKLDAPGIGTLAEIVHEIDLRDGRYSHPEASGVDTLLKGWLLANHSDKELETRGIQLFEGLYVALSQRPH